MDSKRTYICHPRDSTILRDSTIRQDSNVNQDKLAEAMITGEGCPWNVLAIKDALEALEGRWKLLIMFSLSTGSKRFTQISKEMNGITDKVLSKELKTLEINKLIKREVHDTFPPTVEYSITNHGKSLQKVLNELYAWGLEHRKEIMGK